MHPLCALPGAWPLCLARARLLPMLAPCSKRVLITSGAHVSVHGSTDRDSFCAVLPRSELPDNLFPEPQYPQSESKTRKLWGRLEDAYEDPEKLEALILEILHDQPTILAAAVDSEFGQGVRQATVMRAVWEARPMLNLLVGILSKYVPADAWNREVRSMCEQLQSVFGKPGVF